MTAARLPEVRARQEVALACSLPEACEEGTIVGPTFHPMRELRVRELRGLPGHPQGPRQFHCPPGFRSRGSRPVPAASRSVPLGQGGPPAGVWAQNSGGAMGGVDNAAPRAWRGAQCSRIRFPPLFTSCGLRGLPILCASVYPPGKATGPHHGIP